MKQIPLTQGKFALVDDEDFEYLNNYKWHAHKNAGLFYARRNEMCYENGRYTTVLMHRTIMKLTESSIFCDHINHNGLDNRRANLRACTQADNVKNRSSTKGSTSKYLGVSWHKGAKKWRVMLRINTKNKYIGVYDCELNAARAYNEAAKIHHGEFANLNIIPEETNLFTPQTTAV